MIAALLFAVAAVQGESLKLAATVDRDRIAAGEELVYTLRAESHSLSPIEVTLAPVTGFEVAGRIERSELSSGGTPTRTTILEIQLRAIRPGRWRLGPARARQETQVVEAGALTVQVDPSRGPGPATTALSPRVRRLIERAPLPLPGKPSVTLIVSADMVRVGEQVDVVTAAWFPRDLRLQLSRPPTLQPPVMDGVWTYPQASPAAIAATRTIGGMVYDLFVAHQIVFPLVAGTVTVPPATLKYGTPVALQFFGQEERFALTSRPVTFVVQPLPTTGRPTDFAGAVGARLRLERRLTATTARLGQAVAIEYVLSGDGNTALWPVPTIRWPAAVRAYAERVEEKVATTEGRLGGSKIFRYLIVPDSIGVLRLPEVGYAYFDLAASRYRDIVVGPAAISVVAAEEASATAAMPPSLLPPGQPAWSWRVAHDVPDWVWLLLLALPPFAIMARSRLLPRVSRRRGGGSLPSAGDPLAIAEERLEAAIAALVLDPTLRVGRGVEAALRAAGVDVETIAGVVAARERVLATRYAPHDRGHDPRLVADIDALIQRLARLGYRWRGEIAVLLLLLLPGFSLPAVPTRAAAQAPPPERLYESGALRAAAEGFASRTATDSAVAAHWYGLGASYYRLGLKGRAAAAWLHARRLAPREASVRRALELTPSPDPVSARWTWVPPVRPDELLLAGMFGWVIAWFGWVGRPRARDRWTILLVFSAAAVLAGLALRQWYRRPVAIAVEGAELRLSPHGRAPALARLESGGAVLLLQERPGWVLVRAPDSREGWLPVDAVAPIGG